jgi:nucleotide-binding universal stress UspA family protein
MRRILVPLDGSDLSTSILDDAMRLAGPDGTLLLVQEVRRVSGRAAAMHDPVFDTEEARQYLNGVAEGLRSRGISVATTVRTTFHVAEAIDAAARANEVDMIACATHSRGSIGSILWGSVAWKVVTQSPVPVMLRHPVLSNGRMPPASGQRRILVPLDGSPLAEKALPLAEELAAEWGAPIDVVLIVPRLRAEAERGPMEEYLTRIVGSLAGKVQGHVMIGDPVEELIAFVRGSETTDVVMTTHGRTGLARVFLGSVAYDLVHRLPIPVILTPALETQHGQYEKIPVNVETTPVGSSKE